MTEISDPQDPSGFVHPLQSVLDAMGNDPALHAERRRIQDYIAKSAVVMSSTEGGRPEMQEHRLKQFRKEARAQVEQGFLAAPLSERDREWLNLATHLLKVLTENGPAETDASMRDEYGNVVNALIMGAYARLAPDAMVEDLARERLEQAIAEEGSKSE